MDFKLNREPIVLNEIILDTMQEQSVELDYVLPDYYPDIFRMIKCCLQPRLVSYTISGDKISYDLNAELSIIYLSENSSRLHCIRQKLSYNKIVSLADTGENMSAAFDLKCGYVNCRVVNKRRIDIHGLIETGIKVQCSRHRDVICDAFGMNVQLKKQNVSYISQRLTARKTFNINEEFQLSDTLPPVLSILHSDVKCIVSEKKIIANKLVVKGEMIINILYSCEDTKSMQTMQFNVPFSQIVDMDNADENYTVFAEISVSECDINSCGSENHGVKCDITAALECTALKSSCTAFVTDAYSTTFPCETANGMIKVSAIPLTLSENHQVKFNADSSGNPINCIYDVWCSVSKCTTEIHNDTHTAVITGAVMCTILAGGEGGSPVIVEKEEPFEHRIESDIINGNTIIEPIITVSGCSYNLNDAGNISVKADLCIGGTITNSWQCNVLTDIEPDETSEKVRDGDYTLKLYYGIENEDVWEIAKRYSTSVRAIMEENDLSDDRLSESGMLLIPIVY